MWDGGWNGNKETVNVPNANGELICLFLKWVMLCVSLLLNPFKRRYYFYFLNDNIYSSLEIRFFAAIYSQDDENI